MKIDVTTVLTDVFGKPILMDEKKPEGDKLTLAAVLTNALLAAPHPQGSSYPADQTIKRYDLALIVNRAGEAQPEVEITADMATTLKADINRLYAPIIAGQVLPMLDGK